MFTEKDWMNACKNGDLELIRKMHSDGFKSDGRFDAIAGAAKENHVHVVDWLIENCRECCNDRTFKLIAHYGNLPMIQKISHSFSDECKKNNFYGIALQEAINSEQREVFDWLLTVIEDLETHRKAHKLWKDHQRNKLEQQVIKLPTEMLQLFLELSKFDVSHIRSRLL